MEHCIICGKSEVIRYGMCHKHYMQYRNHGMVLDSNQRSIFDRNEIRLHNDYGEIDTYDNFGNVNCTYKFSLEDFHFLNCHKWYTTYKGRNKINPYLVSGNNHNKFSNVKEKTVYFHRLIFNFPSSEIDHINRDTTDNRRCNLRLSDREEQCFNTSLRIDNIQGIKGVYFCKRDNKFRAEIRINGKTFASKYFLTKQEAVYMRFLLEEYFLENKIHNNFTLMHELILSLTDEQKQHIRKYFENKTKVWV